MDKDRVRDIYSCCTLIAIAVLISLVTINMIWAGIISKKINPEPVHWNQSSQLQYEYSLDEFDIDYDDDTDSYDVFIEGEGHLYIPRKNTLIVFSGDEDITVFKDNDTWYILFEIDPYEGTY